MVFAPAHTPRPLAFRLAFWLYAAALFTLTHFPKLAPPPVDIPRPDLLIHFACFGLWYILFYLTGYARDRCPPRAGLLRAWLIAAVYAAFDEALQLVPFIQRHAAWDDYAANLGGVTLGLLTVLVLSRWIPHRASQESSR